MSKVYSLSKLKEEPKIVEEMFFAAMLGGYASGLKPGKILQPVNVLKHGHYHNYVSDLWMVIDEWFISDHSDFSWGSTTIFYGGNPIWAMQYFGRYSNEATNHLKAALRHQYQRRKFLGGRGPRQFDYGSFQYANDVGEGSTFEDFHGHEAILSTDLSLRGGWHRYHGGLLL